MAEAVIAVAPERRLAAVGALTFRAYALKNEELRLRIRDSFASGYDAGAAWFRSIEEEGDLPMPPDILVRVINALIEGLLFQRFTSRSSAPMR